MVKILRAPVLNQQPRKLNAQLAGNQIEESSSAESDAPSKAASALPQAIEDVKQAVLAQFKHEAESAREMARQRGLEEGRQEGLAAARQDVAHELARIRAVAEGLQARLHDGIEGLEPLAVSIAYEAVIKILGEAAPTEERVAAVVRQAASHTSQHEGLVIRLNPTDLSMLRESGLLEDLLGDGSNPKWVSDKRLSQGGCVIETDMGELDARLEAQLDAFRVTLTQAHLTH